MSRRITFSIDEINNEKAIQPRQDELVENQYRGMTVVRVVAIKEGAPNATESFQVDHRRYSLTISANASNKILPQTTATKEEVIAEGGAATAPNKVDHRLVELIRIVLKRMDILFFDCFSQEFAKSLGQELAKGLVAILKWLLLIGFSALLIFLSGR